MVCVCTKCSLLDKKKTRRINGELRNFPSWWHGIRFGVGRDGFSSDICLNALINHRDLVQKWSGFIYWRLSHEYGKRLESSQFQWRGDRCLSLAEWNVPNVLYCFSCLARFTSFSKSKSLRNHFLFYSLKQNLEIPFCTCLKLTLNFVISAVIHQLNFLTRAAKPPINYLSTDRSPTNQNDQPVEWTQLPYRLIEK